MPEERIMNAGLEGDAVKQALRELVVNFGADALKQSDRVMSYLSEKLPQNTRERRMVANALEEGLPGKLMAVPNNAEDRNEATSQAVEHMQDMYGMALLWAEFTVDCLTFALGWGEESKEAPMPPISHVAQDHNVNYFDLPMSECIQRAENGDLEAMVYVGVMYEGGDRKSVV